MAWVRDTFTDHDKLQPGAIICHACQFAFAESSDELALLVGKDKPQRMRNYSHFVIGNKWLPLSKGNKMSMRNILTSGDWQIAIVADSGQKHIIFRAIPHVIQFEEHQIRNWHDLGVLLEPIETLYSAGFAKGEIEIGQYAHYRILQFGISQWMALENKIKSSRQSALFALALFLAQKGGSTDGNARESGILAMVDMAGSTDFLQEPLPPHDLAAVREQCAGSGIHKQPGEIYQLPLF